MFSRKKGLAVYLLPFALFCALWVWLPLGIREDIRNVFVGVQAPIYSAISDTSTFIAKVKKNLISKGTLLAEYEKLARMNSYLQVCIDDMVNASQGRQNSNKKSVLESIESRFNFIYANVVRRDLASWSDELVINRGAQDAIQVGDGVISGNIVVGRIKKVFRNLSIVELLSAPTFRMSACLENDNFPVIFHGNANSDFTQYSGIAENIVTNLSENRSRKIGKVRLVSSYLSDIFPGGVTIGYINKIDDMYGGMFTKTEVELDANFINTIREVAVLSRLQVK